MDAAEQTFIGADRNRLSATLVGTGPLTLLLHGGGQNRHSWRRTALHLAGAGHTAAALDLRGHGDSDWVTSRRYTIDAYADDLQAVLDQLPAGRPPPALVGASLGGMAALALLGRHPAGGVGVARTLVLVDVAPRMAQSGIQRVRGFMMAAPDGFLSVEEAAVSARTYLDGRGRPVSIDGLARNLRRWPDGRFRWHWDPRVLEEVRTHEERVFRQQRRDTLARAVRVPTVLVHGARSDVVTPESVRQTRLLMPEIRVAAVEGAGHMLAGDHNDDFQKVVLAAIADGL